MMDMVNLLVIKDDYCLPFKNNVEYARASFMQASKMIKGLMTTLFINFNLTPIQEYLYYKNIDNIRAMLIELAYYKVTW